MNSKQLNIFKKSVQKIDFTLDNSCELLKMYTPIQCRQLIARLLLDYGKIDDISIILKHMHINPDHIPDKEQVDSLFMAIKSLLHDVIKINEYHRTSDIIDEVSFKKWFPKCNNILPLTWINVNRDYIYNSHGLRILINRYLRPNEPIQFCMLRMAKLLFGTDWDDFDRDEQYGGWFMFYTLLSCGFVHISSVLADADQADPTIISGEACRLVVATKNYDREFIKQMEEVSKMISLGVGVGMGASTIPRVGTKENGKIHGGFRNVVKKLDSCNQLSIYERKPKIALYISIHNDTIFDVFDLRTPTKEHIENVFFGVMINDYYMYCLRNKYMWYLFPGNVTLNGKYLSDFSGAEYVTMYKKFVDAKLYTRKIMATDLMELLLNSIAESGSPYVIWDDVVNRYNNHMHLGKIKTLNLCAEITNYASYEETSSCTLISLNFAMFSDFQSVQTSLFEYLRHVDPVFNDLYWNIIDFYNQTDLLYLEQMKFSYMLGYMGTWMLNMFMGKDRKQRELGISPMGIYDMAVMTNSEPEKLIGPVSDTMYLGAIQSSCKYSHDYNVICNRYMGSPFSMGRPQWMLRNKQTYIKWPKVVFSNMRAGMANSMLTAQAPTATTAMLCGVTDSVTLPLSILMSKESENGRNAVITYGILNHILCNSDHKFNLKNDISLQVELYAKSAPFIDQSQSTIFHIDLTKQNIFNLLKATYLAELKTAIYYIIPKPINPTLNIIRSTVELAEHYATKFQKNINQIKNIEDDKGLNNTCNNYNNTNDSEINTTVESLAATDDDDDDDALYSKIITSVAMASVEKRINHISINANNKTSLPIAIVNNNTNNKSSNDIDNYDDDDDFYYKRNYIDNVGNTENCTISNNNIPTTSTTICNINTHCDTCAL